MKRMKERESKHWRKDKQAGNWSDYENKRVLRREAGSKWGGWASKSRLSTAPGSQFSAEAIRYQKDPQVDKQPCLGQGKLRGVPRPRSSAEKIGQGEG